MIVSLAKPPRPSQPIMDLVLLCGMNQEQAAEYLTAHGVKTSAPAVKAWATGKYAPKPEAVQLLWTLWVLVEGGGMLPEHTPDVVIRRQAAIATLRAQVASMNAGQVQS